MRFHSAGVRSTKATIAAANASRDPNARPISIMRRSKSFIGVSSDEYEKYFERASSSTG